MILVAQQGQRWLIYDGEGPPGSDAEGLLVDEKQGRTWRVALASFLARGYWDRPSPISEQELQGLADRYPVEVHSTIEVKEAARPI